MQEHSENTKTDTCDNAVLSNRLFKFRAFIQNELGGFMIPNEDTDCFMVSNGNGFTVYDEYKNTISEDRISLMQFTGFTDKKGTEIYESDICKYHKNTSKWLVSYNFEVRFKNGAFYAYWEREMLGKLEQHWDLLSLKDMRNIRVVSNIHKVKQAV